MMHRETVGDWLSLLFFLQATASTALLYGVATWWRDFASALMWLNLMVPADTPGVASVVDAVGLKTSACSAGSDFFSNLFAVAITIVCAVCLRVGVSVALTKSSLWRDSTTVSEEQPTITLPRLLQFPTPECFLALSLVFGLLLSSMGALLEGCSPVWVLTLAVVVLLGVLGGALGLYQTLECGLTTIPVGGHGHSFIKSHLHIPAPSFFKKWVASAKEVASLAHLVAFKYDRHCVAVVAGGSWGGVLDVAYEDANHQQRAVFWLKAWLGLIPTPPPLGRWVIPAFTGTSSAHAFEMGEPMNESMEELESRDIGDVMSLDFDVRKVLSIAGPERTLTLVAAKLFRRNGLLVVDDATSASLQEVGLTADSSSEDAFKGVVTWTTEVVFYKWVRAVESAYLAMPYHNSAHAADVMVTVNSFLVHSGLQPRRATHARGSQGSFADPNWQLAQFSLLVAAIVHDVGHVGVMNAHLKAIQHPLTLQYPDVPGVLEAMHAAEALKLMRAPGQNILDAMAPGDSLVVRQQIVDLVLVTDLSKQAAFLKAWHEKRVPPPPPPEMAVSSSSSNATGAGASIKARGSWQLDMNGSSEECRSDRLMFLKLLLKAADVSNPTKATPLYLFWTNRILEEFYHQGDEEKEKGLPLSPGCDRFAPNLPRGQLGFINFVVKPTFDAIKVFLDDQPPPRRRSAINGPGYSTSRLDTSMRHLDANIAFWKRAAAELQTPAQLQNVKFPRDLPLRFLQLAEATGKDGASAVDQMPPLDELTRQLEVQMLENGQLHSMDDFNAEIASAVVHHQDHSKVKDLSRDSVGDDSRSGNLAVKGENTKGLSHLSQPLQSTDHEQASARGAAFLFQWGGLFARYTPPQRNFLALDVGLRKALLALALALAQNGASVAQAIMACLVSLVWLVWLCWEPPCISVHRSRVEVADAFALFVATAAHALAMSSEALEDSNVPEDSFLGGGRDAAAGATVVALALTLCLHVKVLLWGHNGAGRRFTKACAAHVSTLTTYLVHMWKTTTAKAPTKSSSEGTDQRAIVVAHGQTASSAQESSNNSAAQTAESIASHELTAASTDSPKDANTSSSNNKASSEPHLNSKAQEKVDTLLVRRMSLDLRGNASFTVELEGLLQEAGDNSSDLKEDGNVVSDSEEVEVKGGSVMPPGTTI